MASCEARAARGTANGRLIDTEAALARLSRGASWQTGRQRELGHEIQPCFNIFNDNPFAIEQQSACHLKRQSGRKKRSHVIRREL